MYTFFKFSTLYLICLSWLCLISNSSAQNENITQITEEINVLGTEEVKKKQQLNILLNKAKQLELFTNENQSFQKLKNELPKQTNNIVFSIEHDTFSNKTLEHSDLTEVTTKSNLLKKKLSEIKEKLSSLSISITLNQNRLSSIPEEITKESLRINSFQTKSTPSNSMITRQVQLDLAISEMKIKKLDSEKNYLEELIKLQQTSLPQLQKTYTEIQKYSATWSDKLATLTKNQVNLIKSNLKDYSNSLTGRETLKDIISTTIELIDSDLNNSQVKNELDHVEMRISSLSKMHERLEEQLTYAKKRIYLLESADLPIDLETGQLLRKQRSELPSLRSLKEEFSDTLKKSTENELTILELKNALVRLSDTKGNQSKTLTNTDKLKVIKEDIRTILELSQQERTNLGVQYIKLTENLQQAVDSSSEYSDYLDTRLIWIASHPLLNKQSIYKEFTILKEALSPQAFSLYATTWQKDIITVPLYWALLICVILIYIRYRSKLKTWAKNEHLSASQRHISTLKPTIYGLLSEISLSLFYPLIPAFLGWRHGAFTPLGKALLAGAIVYFISGLLYKLAKEKGFFEANFKPSNSTLLLIRKTVRFIYLFIPPLIILSTYVVEKTDPHPTGRVLIIFSLLLMSGTMHYLLNPKKKLLPSPNYPKAISYFCYLLFVIFPFLLAIAAGVGYYISVLTLRVQLIYSLRAVMLTLFISALLNRWLLISKRKLAMESLQIETLPEDENSDTPQSKKEIIKQRLEKITQISEQSMRFIKVAAIAFLAFSFIAIWSESLQALTILDNINLWETTTEPPSNSQSTSTDINVFTSSDSNTNGSTITESTTSSITLQDLLLSAITAFLTYIAATNIPGLLQITLLNKLKITSGTSFAMITIIRYVIVVTGVIFAFQMIGITWGKVHWLAAAVTLGISFGLQEIFANFVSGIILLFERPMRIGDMVTVAETSGKVTKIKMRATTILQLNNQELIVPNKEFITGNLINWTLSDTLLRAEVAVGVAYGSDTRHVEEILNRLAAENDKIIDDPAWDIQFTSFGASSLDFKLRVYVKSPQDLIQVQSELHFAINDAFNEASIEIAFPQQDIHIKSIASSIPPIIAEPKSSD